MRLISKLLAGGGALALIAAFAAPALADPPNGVTPRASDVVGVGSDTIGYLLDQFSHDYNRLHPKAPVLLYNWDPTNPDGTVGGQIVTKAGCPPITRPDGSWPASPRWKRTPPTRPTPVISALTTSAPRAGPRPATRRAPPGASASSRSPATRSPGPLAMPPVAAPTPRPA